MSGRFEILDRNLQRLLTRSYVPTLPAPAFRQRLERTWLAEVSRRAGGRRAPRRPVLFLVASTLAAAAAVLLLLRATGPPGGDGAEALPAAGGYRLAADGPWRPAGGTLPADWRWIEVRTAGPALLLASGQGGARAHLAPATHLTAELGTDRVRARLLTGGLDVELPEGARPWTLATEEGDVWLEAGRLELRLAERGLELALASGRARLEPAGPELPAGRELVLAAGKLVGAEGAAPEVALGTSDRRALVAPEPERPAPAEPPAETRTTGALRVRVLDAEGRAVPRFRVGLLRARQGPDFETATTRDVESGEGVCLWDDLPPGTYEVFVHAEEHALHATEPLRLGAEVRELGVRLERGHEVAGYVVDAVTGLPLADADVLSETDLPSRAVLFHPDEPVARRFWIPTLSRSGPDGRFVLRSLSTGEHVLKVSLRGRAPTWVRVTAGETPAPAAELVVRLDVGGDLEGRVLDASGAPVVGAQVVATQRDGSESGRVGFAYARTDEEGRYALADLPLLPLMAILIDTADGIPSVRPVSLRRGETTRQDFGERSGTRVHGTLTDAEGVPVVRRNLALFEREELRTTGEDWTATTTDTDGRFTFEAVPPGVYFAFTVADDGSTLEVVGELEVEVREEERHDLSLGARRLGGRVTDALTDEPVAAARVVLGRLDEAGQPLFAGSARTAADGSYSFSSLPDGAYRVVVHPVSGELGFAIREGLRLDEERPFATADVRLDSGGRLALDLVSADGAPVERARVVLVDETGERFALGEEPLTDARGRYAVGNVRAGRFEAEVTHPDFETARAPLEILAGRESSLRLVLTPPESAPLPGGR